MVYKKQKIEIINADEKSSLKNSIFKLMSERFKKRRTRYLKISVCYNGRNKDINIPINLFKNHKNFLKYNIIDFFVNECFNHLKIKDIKNVKINFEHFDNSIIERED